MNNYSEWMSYEDFRDLSYALLKYLCNPMAPNWNRLEVQVYKQSSIRLKPKPKFFFPEFGIWNLSLSDLDEACAFLSCKRELLRIRFCIV